MLCYITFDMGYVITHVSCGMLYNMCHVMLNKMYYVVMLYNICHVCVMLYNMCHMFCYITCVMLCYDMCYVI